MLCDLTTFASLTDAEKQRYSGPETITGKRDETFAAHRCILDPTAAKDAEPFTGPAGGGPPDAAPPKPTPANEPPPAMRREILALFPKLRPHQFDDLVFLLEVPIHQRPSEVLDFERKKNELLKWAEGPPSKLENLLDELRELVGVPPSPQ